MTDLQDRVAIITGAAGGIGRAAVRRFLGVGARVLAVDSDPAVLEGWGPDDAGGGRLRTLRGDLTREAACEAMAAAARRGWGPVRVLFNVAGGSGRRHGDGPVDQCSEAGWDWVMDTNAKSVFLACRAVLPEMMASGGGSIINLSSVLGTVGGGPLFATHAYAASKAAVIGLTRAMAAHYAPWRIRVNVLCPGLVDTPMAARAIADPPTLNHVRRMQPLLGGPVAPGQVADAALFLASEGAGAITGAVLPVDGGWLAQ